MLESAAERLMRRGGPHFGSPDKVPAVRLATIAAAGEAAVPFTCGILIGIGETRRERIEALLALRALHERYGHHPGNHHPEFPRQARHADGRRAPSRDLAEHLWTIAVARIDLRAGDEHPGAAQSRRRRARRSSSRPASTIGAASRR